MAWTIYIWGGCTEISDAETVRWTLHNCHVWSGGRKSLLMPAPSSRSRDRLITTSHLNFTHTSTFCLVSSPNMYNTKQISGRLLFIGVEFFLDRNQWTALVITRFLLTETLVMYKNLLYTHWHCLPKPISWSADRLDQSTVQKSQQGVAHIFYTQEQARELHSPSCQMTTAVVSAWMTCTGGDKEEKIFYSYW